jgi:hypothetical protein
VLTVVLGPTGDALNVVLLLEYLKRDSGAGTPGTGAGSRPPSASSVASGCWGGDVSSGGTGYQQRRGSLQLWQFLVALLDDPSNSSCIAWTGRGMEFKLVEPEEVGTCCTRWLWRQGSTGLPHHILRQTYSAGTVPVPSELLVHNSSCTLSVMYI